MPNHHGNTGPNAADLVKVASGSTPNKTGVSTNQSAGSTGNTDHTNHEVFIKKWHLSLSILHQGHWDAARKYESMNMTLGILTAIAATLSGTTAFAQLKDRAGFSGFNVWLQIAVGTLALVAAALGAVQAFVRPSELAARHKQAAQKYGQLRRKLEVHLEEGQPAEHDKREEILNGLRSDWDKVDEECLPVPKKIYDNAETRFESKHGHSHEHATIAN
jgi:hypothetical protein